MEIIVNTRLLLKNKLEGIGWFSYETLKRITQQHPQHHFIFLFDRDFDEEFIFSDNITPLILSPQARHPVLHYIWFEYSVASILNRLKPDLFLSPDGYLSLHSHCKQLAVIHDINFEHYPKGLSFITRSYYRYYFPKFAKRANRIATVSEFSKNDLIQTYGISSEKIDVVYNGCNTSFKPINDSEKLQVRNQFTEGAEFFLFVGALHPRKNLVRLFLAFDQFKSANSNPVKLVIVGNKYYWTSEIKNTYLSLKFKKDIVFTGRLDADDLRNVLASALALTYVPYFEGFGIPILEGMNCDVPVITSNVTSMPEVAGNAALLVDPFSVNAIADAMLKIYKSPETRKQLIQNGRLQKLHYSWDKTAGLLWDSIEKTCSSQNK